jgi:hypothetical protein
MSAPLSVRGCGGWGARNRPHAQLDPGGTEALHHLQGGNELLNVLPQVKRLCPSLNMPFADLDDPKDLVMNVSGIDRWGNGDVDLGVATLVEMFYVMRLIRQP